MLQKLSDKSLHEQLKGLVSQERGIQVQILTHLKEVERRKLFCDYKRSSLFEYAVTELGYSEAEAHRRIQAMRLMKEIPEVEDQLVSGQLSLTNAALAQGLFNRKKKQDLVPYKKFQKRQILSLVMGKSTRAAQRALFKYEPKAAVPKDQEREISDRHIELRMVIDLETKRQLDQVRSLLGAKGSSLTLNELVKYLAELGTAHLNAKKFGKRRSKKLENDTEELTSTPTATESSTTARTPADAMISPKTAEGLPVISVDRQNKNPRYISKALRFKLWTRDNGRCTNCGSQTNLQVDHIKPVALGGDSNFENLRLLCFNCNQRSAIRSFGTWENPVEWLLQERDKQIRAKFQDSKARH
jgi:hypothetical protein